MSEKLSVKLCVLTLGRFSSGTGQWEVLRKVDVAHVTSTAAEVVCPILDLWREVRYHTAVITTTLVVTQVSPAT